jgi:hypothetical protein
MYRGNKLWEGHRMILPEHRSRMLEQEAEPYVLPELLEDEREEIQYRILEAMLLKKPLTLVVGETDGEHTVEGCVVAFRSESQSLQIDNEWGRFHIPMQNIVRVL